MRLRPTHRRGPVLSAVVASSLIATLAVGPTAFAGGDVATLASPGPEATAGAGPQQDDVDAEQAMLDYARCMRDHGVDLPDPQFSGGGGAVFSTGGVATVEGGDDAGPVNVFPVDDPTFRAASEACDPLLLAGLPPVDPELQAEMQADALAYARCMREHGVDMPDPQFAENGMITMSIGGTTGDVDFTSDDFQAAQAACGDGAGFGVGSVEVPGGGDAGATVP